MRSVKPDPKAFGLRGLGRCSRFRFRWILFAVNREYYKGAARNVEGYAKSYTRTASR